MFDMNAARHPTTALGVPLLPLPDAAGRLAAAGLHVTDPRYAFALSAVRAAAPERRAAIAARFASPKPAEMPLPAIDPSCRFTPSLFRHPNGPMIRRIVDLLAAPMPWATRGELIREFLGNAAGTLDAPSVATARYVLTIVYETLDEPAIACIEQAWFATQVCHSVHRVAAAAWLKPYTESWLYDWLRARPGLFEFAVRAVEIDTARASAITT